MYIPRRFEEKDRDKIFSFIRQNSFAILVTVNGNLPVASHIPLALEQNDAGDDILVGHISIANGQKYALTDGTRVLCIFPGPHAYISPRWYTALNVPTWNYLSVHVYGTVQIIEGEALKAALSRLVDNYEQQLPKPVKMEEIPTKMLHDDLRGIIGFEIKIDEIQAAAKLSQNRDEESFHNIVENLRAGDDSAGQVADAMEQISLQLFKTK